MQRCRRTWARVSQCFPPVWPASLIEMMPPWAMPSRTAADAAQLGASRRSLPQSATTAARHDYRSGQAKAGGARAGRGLAGTSTGGHPVAGGDGQHIPHAAAFQADAQARVGAG
jgi:hypothetical protein